MAFLGVQALLAFAELETQALVSMAPLVLGFQALRVLGTLAAQALGLLAALVLETQAVLALGIQALQVQASEMWGFQELAVQARLYPEDVAIFPPLSESWWS